MFKRLMAWLRKYFTHVILEEEPLPCIQDTTRDKPKNRRRQTPKTVPPSERFIFAMALLMIALVGLIVLEGIYIVVTGQVNSEMIAAISGLIGGLVTAFLLGKKQ
jgi:hypothetical protein